MLKKLQKIAALTIIGSSLSLSSVNAQTYEANWNSLDKRATPQWWSDAKFGIFIHWGPYSVPAYAPVDDEEGVYEKYAEHYLTKLMQGKTSYVNFQKKYYGENSTYDDFIPMFKAEFFNPDRWADLFKKSGAGYVVLTSKHHDGFALWPSKETKGRNSVDAGPKRDIANELTEAVKKTGLRMGFYYSLLEWANPLYTSGNMDKWTTEYMLPQMKDLVTRYKPEVIFSDGEWDYNSKELKSEQFLQWLYNDSPVKNSVVVNDRWGKDTRSKHGGYYTTEYDLIGDTVNTKRIEHPWEESRGIGTSYGYSQFERLEHYSSTKQLIDLLIDKVSNGGNLLLNVGPKANGLIPVIMEERLLDMGKWLKINGEAIYGTTAWAKRPSKMKENNTFYTQKGKDLYVLCTAWPNNNLIVPGVKSATKVSLLGSNVKVNFKNNAGNLVVTVPSINPGNMPSEHAWVFKIENFN